MNKEDYVSMEVAKLLKEKGYNEPVYSQYTNHESVWYCNEPENFNESTDCYSRPTLYEAQKWLRNKHTIYVVVSPHYSRMYDVIEHEYMIATYFDFLEKPFKWRKSKEYYEIYEQCLNAVILEALKLI